jgi:hypothetical protein
MSYPSLSEIVNSQPPRVNLLIEIAKLPRSSALTLIASLMRDCRPSLAELSRSTGYTPAEVLAWVPDAAAHCRHPATKSP